MQRLQNRRAFLLGFLLAMLFLTAFCGLWAADANTSMFGFAGSVPVFGFTGEDLLQTRLCLFGETRKLPLDLLNRICGALRPLHNLIPAPWRLVQQGAAVWYLAADYRLGGPYQVEVPELYRI